MRFRFTLSNDILGTSVLAKNPEGWETMEVLIKRGLDTHGLFYEQAVNLRFFCNGAGKEFIDQVRDEQGIDGVVNILIEIACQDGDEGQVAPDYSIDYSDDYGSLTEGSLEYDEFYTGVLEMKSWSSDDIYTSVNIIQSDFFQKVRNRLDTKVDLMKLETLDGTVLTPFDNYGPYPLTLHSKVIRQIGEFNYSEPGPPAPDEWAVEGSDLDSYTIVADVIESSRTIDHSFSQTLIPEITVFDEIPGYNETTLNTLVRSDTYPGDNSQIQSDTFYEINNTVENLFTITGKIRIGFGATIVFTDNNLFPSPTSDFQFKQDILNPTFYVKAGGSIIYSEVLTDSINTVTLDVATDPTEWTLLPFFERYVEFSISDVPLVQGDIIQVYLKYDSHKVFERPSSPSSFYKCDVTMYGYVKEQYSVDEKSFIKVVSDSTTASTTAPAFAIFEAGARIAQVIGDRTDAFRSNYFGRTNSQPKDYVTDGCGSKRAIAGGFGIRGYPTTGSNARTIRMSMNEYFQGLNCIDNLGLGIEKEGDLYYLTIERKEYFYDSSTVLLTLSNVRDLVRSEAPEYYYGRVNIGYEKWTTEFSNGLDEVNSKRQFDTGIKAVENQLTLNSNLVASGYRIEAARRKRYSDTVTEDTEYDEDNFVICLTEDLLFAEKNENFDQVNNTLSPETAYNLRLWPEFNYLRWNNVINAGLTKYPGRQVKFTSGEGNYKASMEYTNDDCPGHWNNELLVGGQPIQWDDTNNTDKNPLWLPETATIKYPISYTQFKILKANPKGVIMISETDTDHVPYYILEARYIPANGGLADFKLLRAFQ